LAAAQDGASLDDPSAIQPLLAQYCYACHADEVTEAEVDLAVFKTTADARKQIAVWLKVREMLDSGQMPPRDSAQPTDAERTRLQKWVRDFLASEARASAGDPGPVLLRRLSNPEYTHTIRDLTGVNSLDPAGEFPVDGAAGEGFTNVGSGQGMSPALVQKYLDAAKQLAAHMVLLPDGIRFSPSTTRRDQTDELLARIQAFYRQYTEDGGGSAVDLQGIKFDTNQGGLLPLEKYLAATLAERDALTSGRKTIDSVARERSLSPRYLAKLWETLAQDSGDHPSLLVDALREKWRRAKVEDAAALVAEIESAQKALWKFNPVGHIGRQDGPTCWMEAVSPITTSQDLRFKLPDASPGTDVVIYLAASDLGDGNAHDFVVWQRARIEFPAGESGSAHPPVLLRDVRTLAQRIETAIASESARTKAYLDAVNEVHAGQPEATTSDEPDSGDRLREIAKRRGLSHILLQNWAAYAGFSRRIEREVTGHFTEKVIKVQGYEAINGWGSPQTPSLLTNRSDQPITFLTLTVPARGVTVHPSPTLDSVVAWQSPQNAQLRIEGLVADADDKCGNGAAWRLELRSDSGASVLASGIIDNGRSQRFQPEPTFDVRAGDVVSLVVNARDGSHACDTTHIQLKLSQVGGEQRVWNLATDIVDHVLDSNPLPDSYGNRDVWHFCASASKPPTESAIPPGSTLARWRAAVLESKPGGEIEGLAKAVQDTLTAQNADTLADPDKALLAQVRDWKGPLGWARVDEAAEVTTDSGYGLDPSRFGKHPDGRSLDATDLCLQAPQVVEVRLPSALVAGGEFAAACNLAPLPAPQSAPEAGRQAGDSVPGNAADHLGSVQLRVLAAKPDELDVSPALPILVRAGGQAQRRVKAAMGEFRDLFPPALCYARIVPVDEVVTLTLFYREDDQLKRLMLDEQQVAELDRLWDELYYVSREPIQLTVAFEQISEFATQDRPDLVKAFAPLEKPINDRADEFRRRLIETEPAHLDAVLRFADRAWRRPLSGVEQQGLHALYVQLRDSELPHEEAIRLVLARVLTAPAFLYKLEQPAPGEQAAPVSDLELATRLSYFLWSSLPDAELRAAAEAGRLARHTGQASDANAGLVDGGDPDRESELVRQTRRMLRDARTRRLAIQFACQWLHVREFDTNEEKNENLYPEFVDLRDDMYEETIRFFEDMFRNDGKILDILTADHTFLNETLARHYGIQGVTGNEWRRVEGVRGQGRGGILAMATVLASQSGASRTSPILRGNWVYETLLGERLPRPPAGVPQLPETVPSGLTARELIEQHSSAPACAKCHVRIDPYGFALEQYDAIGRLRPQKVDTRTTVFDGKTVDGIEGLRDYLTEDRRDDVLRQFCRKLLGYALGREVQLSDEPLLEQMLSELRDHDDRFSAAVITIVRSRQFQEIRGQDEGLGQ